MTIRDWTETDEALPRPMEFAGVLTPQRLVELYADDVWKYASSKLRRKEDAEDAAMETFTAAIREFDRVRKAESPRLWLLAIARHKVHDAIRRSYRRAESPLEEHLPAAEAKESVRRESLHAAMAEMPDLHREILVLKYVNGLSTEEVAKVIRKSAAATNSLLQRARNTLRERAQPLLEPQGGTV